MKAGFIGLGQLGRAIANRLISQSVDLVVWNRTSARAEGMNAEIATSPAEVINKASVVLLCLFDSAAVRAVLTGSDEIAEPLLSGNCKGKLIVDLTTNHFNEVPDFYSLVEKADADYVESPVLGSIIPASRGELAIMVSGTEKSYRRARPFLEIIGEPKNIFQMPARTLATKMKLINNMVLGAVMGTLSEAVAMADSIGLETESAIEILASGAGNTSILSAKRQRMIDREFSPHFSATLIRKDLDCLLDLAKELGKSALTGQAGKQLFDTAIEQGQGDKDISVIYDLLSKRTEK
jgi:3-hydroxyisobutyrate dehydrogenase